MINWFFLFSFVIVNFCCRTIFLFFGFVKLDINFRTINFLIGFKGLMILLKEVSVILLNQIAKISTYI